jgi:hypothetical protein
MTLPQQITRLEAATVFVAGHVVPLLLLGAAFTFLYRFLPYTHVRLSAAAVGGLAAAVSWQISGMVFAALVASSTTYAAISRSASPTSTRRPTSRRRPSGPPTRAPRTTGPRPAIQRRPRDCRARGRIFCFSEHAHDNVVIDQDAAEAIVLQNDHITYVVRALDLRGDYSVHARGPHPAARSGAPRSPGVESLSIPGVLRVHSPARR